MTKVSKTQQKKWDNDEELSLLLMEYFTGLLYEIYPKTPKVTQKLDVLEKKIRTRKEELTIKRNKKENQ